MSTADQKHSSVLHGEALRRADRPEIAALVAELAEVAQGRHDIRTECAGTLAGSWLASPATTYAEHLIAAGLLLLAGPVDGDEIIQRVREGFQRKRQQASGYDPGR